MDDLNNINPNRPQLRKVKRPINRQPQAPAAFSDNVQSNTENSNTLPEIKDNPFVQQESNAQKNEVNTDNSFDINAFLDEGYLPTNNDDFTEKALSEANASKYHSDISNEYVPVISKKNLIFSALALFFMGIIIGKFVFTESKVVRDGLQGVVINSEVPKGRARCGVAERTQGCVLYIMNPQRFDANARDFYDLASTLTGRQKFVIETGNIRYANQRIRPGEIAQLNIPPL